MTSRLKLSNYVRNTWRDLVAPAAPLGATWAWLSWIKLPSLVLLSNFLGMFASAKRRVVTLPNAHPTPSPTCSRLSSQYCLRHSPCRTQCPKIYHLGSFLQSPCSLFPARSPSAASRVPDRSSLPAAPSTFVSASPGTPGIF
jgi:hypothetical protein